MKKFSFIAMAGILALAAGIWACGSTNQFGGSFDISMVCDDITCVNRVSNPEVSILSQEALTLYFEFVNTMEYNGAGSGQTVRTRRVEVEYTPPANAAVDIPWRVEQFTLNVEPGDSLVQPLTVFGVEQAEYIRDRQSAFPDIPFQLGCRVTVFYDTTGGQTGSVERSLSIQVNY